jgi:hypothetical protein
MNDTVVRWAAISRAVFGVIIIIVLCLEWRETLTKIGFLVSLAALGGVVLLTARICEPLVRRIKKRISSSQ